MRLRRPTALLLAAGTALAAAGPAFASDEKPAACVALLVTSVPQAAVPKAGGPPSVPAFSATGVLGLVFMVVMDGRTDFGSLGTLRLRLLTPRGNLYQEIDVPVAPPDAGESERPVDGYPRPVKVVKPSGVGWNGSRWPAIEFPVVPVAGTSIVTSSLYGRWTAEALVTGKNRRKSCSEAVFTVAQ